MTNQLSHANFFSDLNKVTLRRVFETVRVGSWKLTVRTLLIDVPTRDDLVGVMRVGDQPHLPGPDVGLLPDASGERYLITFGHRNADLGHIPARGDVDQVRAQLLEPFGQLHQLLFTGAGIMFSGVIWFALLGGAES